MHPDLAGNGCAGVHITTTGIKARGCCMSWWLQPGTTRTTRALPRPDGTMSEGNLHHSTRSVSLDRCRRPEDVDDYPEPSNEVRLPGCFRGHDLRCRNEAVMAIVESTSHIVKQYTMSAAPFGLRRSRSWPEVTSLRLVWVHR